MQLTGRLTRAFDDAIARQNAEAARVVCRRVLGQNVRGPNTVALMTDVRCFAFTKRVGAVHNLCNQAAHSHTITR